VWYTDDMTNTLRVLDLFCCEGGASKGYEDAGLRVSAGCDLNPKSLRVYGNWRKNQTKPAIVQGDWREALEEFAGSVSLIHASPPCQRYSSQTRMNGTQEGHPDLVQPVIDALTATGVPFVVENVPQSPLKNMPGVVILNGLMFPSLTTQWSPWTLEHERKILRESVEIDNVRYWLQGKNRKWNPDSGQWESSETGAAYENAVRPYKIGEPVNWCTYRPRLFLTGNGFTFSAPDEVLSRADWEVATVTTSRNPTALWNKLNRQGMPTLVRRELMGEWWMTDHGIGESIPPAFTEYIGKQFLAWAGA
jgi:hypothetical protein